MCLEKANKTMLKSAKSNKNEEEAAKAVAFSALSLLAGNEDKLMNFIGLSGVSPGEIKNMANNNEFLAAVLDYFLNDEPLLLEFCATENVKPAMVHKAAHTLGGGVWEREWA